MEDYSESSRSSDNGGKTGRRHQEPSYYYTDRALNDHELDADEHNFLIKKKPKKKTWVQNKRDLVRSYIPNMCPFSMSRGEYRRMRREEAIEQISIEADELEDLRTEAKDEINNLNKRVNILKRKARNAASPIVQRQLKGEAREIFTSLQGKKALYNLTTKHKLYYEDRILKARTVAITQDMVGTINAYKDHLSLDDNAIEQMHNTYDTMLDQAEQHTSYMDGMADGMENLDAANAQYSTLANGAGTFESDAFADFWADDAEETMEAITRTPAAPVENPMYNGLDAVRAQFNPDPNPNPLPLPPHTTTTTSAVNILT